MAWMNREASSVWQKSTTTSAPLRRSTSTLDERSSWKLAKLVEASTFRPRRVAEVLNCCIPEAPNVSSELTVAKRSTPSRCSTTSARAKLCHASDGGVRAR
eukprot:scaffold40774_cov72-Phaeocystis_antarctica.AAC.5